MDNPKRARSEKPRKQPRECAYVRSPDLQSALERIRQVACRDKGAMEPRRVESPAMGKVRAIPKVGGLHHYYTRHAAA